MSQLEGELLRQARIKTQQSTKFATHQKEADQKARQLFADCAETIDQRGERIKTLRGLDRIFGLTVMSPLAALSHLSPADFLDRKEVNRLVEVGQDKVSVRIETDTAVPAKASEVSIWLGGIDHRLVLSRLGYGEIYLNDPNLNKPTQRQRRANIEDITNFRQAVTSIRDFIETPPVPYPEKIQYYSLLEKGRLEAELRRALRWSMIDSISRPIGAVAVLAGLVALMASTESEALRLGSVFAVASGMVGSLRLTSNLNRKIKIIKDEMASRS